MPDLFTHDAETFTLRVHYPADKLKLFLDLSRKREDDDRSVDSAQLPVITESEVLDLLVARIPADLLDIAVVRSAVKALAESSLVKDRRIAKGAPPKVGRPGRFVMLVKKLQEKPDLAEDERGTVSHTDLHLFDNVSIGQPLARIYPPTEGTPGKDVLGDQIPAEPGSEVTVDFDSETVVLRAAEEIGKPYALLESLAEGYLASEGTKLVVRDELIVPGGLDYSFGNIDFIGSVRIRGEVMSGFRVKAKQAITVEGAVEDAVLICENGDVRIAGFFQGGEQGRAVAAGNFYATGVNQGTVETVGGIFVEREAMHAQLRTESIVSMPTGRIVGGRVYSVSGIEAKQYGSEDCADTAITLCSSIETTAEFSRLVLQIENHEQALKLIASHLGPYAKNRDRIQLLKEPFKGKMEELVQKHCDVEASLSRLQSDREKMLATSYSAGVVRVNVSDVIHPRVVISAGEAVLDVEQPIQGPATVEYQHETEQFVIGELQLLECQISEES